MFGFRKKSKPVTYLLMDRDSHVLGKAELQNDITDPSVQMKLTEGSMERVVMAEVIQVIPPDSKVTALMGRVTSYRGSTVIVEPMRKAGEAVRKNFRMPVSFESFAYCPWGGRIPLRSVDLSCGGIAFYSPGNLDVGDEPEVVIPITAEGPLIVKSRILRRKEYNGPVSLYACQFVDIIPDEEAMIMEAVFTEQMESIRLSRNTKGW